MKLENEIAISATDSEKLFRSQYSPLLFSFVNLFM